MTILKPDATEAEIRRALAAAHRTVATAYDSNDLPLLRWEVDESGRAYAYAWEFDQLAPFTDWLDEPASGHSGTESYDHHWITGTREDVPFKITHLAEFVSSHADMPRMTP